MSSVPFQVITARNGVVSWRYGSNAGKIVGILRREQDEARKVVWRIVGESVEFRRRRDALDWLVEHRSDAA